MRTKPSKQRGWLISWKKISIFLPLSNISTTICLICFDTFHSSLKHSDVFHDLKFLYVNTQHGKIEYCVPTPSGANGADVWFHTDSRTEVFSHTPTVLCSYEAQHDCGGRWMKSTFVPHDQILWVRVQYKTQIIQNSNLVTTGSVAPNNNCTETIYFLVLLHGPHASLGSYMLLYSIVGDSFYAMLTASSTKHSMPVGSKGQRGFINKPVMANLIKIMPC